VLVQEMVNGGIEMILGIHNDQQFGPVVLCGFGGILAELLHDVSIRLCPVGERDAREMVSELKAASVLKGYRGEPARDLEGVIGLIVALSRLACDLMPEMVQTVDINPLMVFDKGKGVKAVDALIVTPASDEIRVYVV
ncbi:MAG: acetate--CoA ligase family protein, partial [Deltaproteobacteria bacterium]|nr:acetate--CoA ligase family protein [Deltaproteobacteria bacterium]